MHVKFIRCWYRECLRQRRPRINYWRNIIAFLDGKWIQLATYILRRLFVLSRYPPTEILNLDNNFLFVCLSVCLSFSLSPIKYEYHILYNILVQNSLSLFIPIQSPILAFSCKCSNWCRFNECRKWEAKKARKEIQETIEKC